MTSSDIGFVWLVPNKPSGWAVDPHHETADTLAVEDAADALAHKLGDA